MCLPSLERLSKCIQRANRLAELKVCIQEEEDEEKEEKRVGEEEEQNVHLAQEYIAYISELLNLLYRQKHKTSIKFKAMNVTYQKKNEREVRRRKGIQP